MRMSQKLVCERVTQKLNKGCFMVYVLFPFWQDGYEGKRCYLLAKKKCVP